MPAWLPNLDERSGPKYTSIASAIEGAIRSGQLEPGERLPPQRDLARLLNVDLTTVTRAYGVVRKAGLIRGAGRLGSHVCGDDTFGSGWAEDLRSGDAALNMPPLPNFSRLAEAIRIGTARLFGETGYSPLLQYQPNGGSHDDRAEAASALVARGIPATEEDVIIASGAQNALHAIFATLFQPGDAICAGRHAYAGMLALALRFRLQVVPVQTDQLGLDPDAVRVAAEQGAKAIFVVPTNDNPTTATLDLERRAALVAVARHHNLMIIEDDAFGQLPEQPLPPLAALAPERVWHIATLSKTVSPVLRVAYVRAPSSGDAWRLSSDLYESMVMAPPISIALVTGWMRDGTLGALIGEVREEARRRQAIVARQLAGIDHAAHPEGYHIWLPLGGGITSSQLTSTSRPTGLYIVPGEAFALGRDMVPGGARLSIGGPISHDALERGLARLATVLRQDGSRTIRPI